jgi:hypothetical protein
MEIPAQSLAAHRIPREQKERTMKRMLIIALPLLLPCLTLGQVQEKKEKAKPVNGGSVEQAVLKLEDETVNAIQKGDCAFIEKNFSDDYINITGNGQMTTKAELVTACKSGQIKYDTYDLKKDRKVRVYGNTAIVISEDEVKVSCLSWNWRGRSSVKITERTHAKRAKTLHPGREGRHPETTPFG